MGLEDENFFVSEADYNAFLRQLNDAKSNVKANELVRDFIPIRLASQSVGGQLKPWGKLFAAMLDGKIRFRLTSGDAPLVQRISIHADDVTMLRLLATKAGEPNDFPTSTTIHKQDALEILNISGDTPVLDGLPFSQRGGRLYYELAVVLDRAAKTITLPEIAQRTTLSVSGAFHEMRRAKVPLLFEGCWCRDRVEKHLKSVTECSRI